MQMKIIRMEHNKHLPEYKTEGSSGMDLYAAIDKEITLKPLERVLVPTGIKIEIVGPTYDNKVYQPIAVENYKNKIGDMIDIQFLAIPITKQLENSEKNETRWFGFKEMLESDEIE